MKKNIVFIVSGGRTGTRFFGDLISQLICNSYSVHEPDVFEDFTKLTMDRIRFFGFYHMVIGRLLGKTGIRNLSQKYLSGKIKIEELIEDLKKHRERYYTNITEELIIEAYYQWYGVLPAIQWSFDKYKILCIVRDPRTWVTSWLNYEAHFGRKDLVKKFAQKRLNPIMIGDKEYINKWKKMSKFQKLCWTWKTVYNLILRHVSQDNNSLIVRYEDIFLSQDRKKHFQKVMEFITIFNDSTFTYKLDANLLNIKVHSAGRIKFPDWPEWTNNLAIDLSNICGPLMKKFGYGMEKEWQFLSKNI